MRSRGQRFQLSEPGRRLGMPGPVYKLWMLKPKEAYYQLSEEEQNSLGAKVREALQKVGGKAIVACNPVWSNEQWIGFGIEEFPDVEGDPMRSARFR